MTKLIRILSLAAPLIGLLHGWAFQDGEPLFHTPEELDYFWSEQRSIDIDEQLEIIAELVDQGKTEDLPGIAVEGWKFSFNGETRPDLIKYEVLFLVLAANLEGDSPSVVAFLKQSLVERGFPPAEFEIFERFAGGANSLPQRISEESSDYKRTRWLKVFTDFQERERTFKNQRERTEVMRAIIAETVEEVNHYGERVRDNLVREVIARLSPRANRVIASYLAEERLDGAYPSYTSQLDRANLDHQVARFEFVLANGGAAFLRSMETAK